MDSLYGGQEGVSFVLKKEYTSVANMIADFKRGANNTDVWYGEYCIINTPNKNDKTNGTIYRRGLNYQDEKTGGAIKVGQVVGPSGATPYFDIQSSIYDVVQKSKQQLSSSYEYRRYPTDSGYHEGVNTGAEDEDIVIKSLSVTKTDNSTAHVDDIEHGSDYDKVSTDKFYTLVPGKDEDGCFKDDIKYTWLNIRRDNTGDEDAETDPDSWFYVGFEIPFLVQDYITHSVTQYDNNGDYSADTTKAIHALKTDNSGNLITDSNGNYIQEDASHPFWNKWDLSIPKGIKGDTLKNLKVVEAGSFVYDGVDKNDAYKYDSSADVKNYIHDIAELTTDKNTGFSNIEDFITGNLATDTYAGFQDDIAHNRQIVIYEYQVFDNKFAGQSVYFYVGDFNTITNIDVADDGTLTVSYTHDDNTVFPKQIKWIKNISFSNGLGAEGAHFQVDYNNEDKPFQRDLLIPEDISINSTGDIVRKYYGDTELSKKTALSHDGTTELSVSEDGVVTEKNVVKWIEDISLTDGLGEEGGHFQIDYNNDETSDKKNSLRKNFLIPAGIDINTTGDITRKYYGTSKASGQHPLNTEDNKVTVEDSGKIVEKNVVKWIKSVNLNTQTYKEDSKDSGKFRMTFNTKAENENEFDYYETPLSWISNLVVNEDGSITREFVGKADDHNELDMPVKWIDKIEQDTSYPSKVTITYNDYLTQTDEQGDTSFIYDSSNNKVKRTQDLDFKLRTPRAARVAPDGTISIKYDGKNDDGSDIIDSLKNLTDDGVMLESDFHLRNLLDVKLSSDIDKDKKINIKYNYYDTDKDKQTAKNNDGYITIGSPINDIRGIAIRSKDYHMFILYGDPSYRYQATNEELKAANESRDIDANTIISIEATNGEKWLNHNGVCAFDTKIKPYYTNDGTTKSMSNTTVFWKDLGTIKDQSGVLVGLNVTYEEVAADEDATDIVSYLNKHYPSGLLDELFASDTSFIGPITGKLVTYQPQPATDDGTDIAKKFYAFDYSGVNGWYYIGEVADSGLRDMIVTTTSEMATNAVVSKLNKNGYVFIKENLSISNDAIPTYWAYNNLTYNTKKTTNTTGDN